MQDKFIYEEKSSRLYAPDGTYLKTLWCPRAKNWNQLVIDDPQDRTRGCNECGERVLNLDILPTEYVLSAMNVHAFDMKPCVAASRNSDKVIFLVDESKPSHKSRRDNHVVIHTARTIEEINRAASAGFWPDVRWIEYKDDTFVTKICIGQDPETGRIERSSDYRSLLPNVVIPFTEFYPYYQRTPIAAYLIPRDLEEGIEVIIADPIEELVGFEWNQGDRRKAMNLTGVVRNRKVELLDDVDNFEVMTVMG